MQFQMLREKVKMKSLVLFGYDQPVHGKTFRWGVLCNERDTIKYPLSWRTIYGPYRKHDEKFKRSRSLDTVKTTEGVKNFYRERVTWRVSIPFVGSLIEKFV